MNTLCQDLQYGLRMLLKHPGVTAIAVITLALGIGANTAIFSVVNAVLLNPLPYREPIDSSRIWENVPTHGRWRAAPANFFDWKKQNTVFEDVAAFGGATTDAHGRRRPRATRRVRRVSSGYFAVVGIEPMLGRTFLAEEYESRQRRRSSYWAIRYGKVVMVAIKTSLTVTSRSTVTSYTVVGVMPRRNLSGSSYHCRPS